MQVEFFLSLKDSLCAFSVKIFVRGRDKEVVNVDNKPSFGDHVSEGAIHESLECCWGIAESDKHDCGFK